MDNNTSSKSNLNTIQNKISNKTKEQLLNEIGRLNNKIADLKKDITKCEQVEKKLMESDEKFRMLSAQPLMGLIILQDELFDYVNIRASEIMEVPVKEIKNWAPKDYAKLIHSEDRDFVMEQGRKKQTGEKGAVIQYEWRMVTPNGNLKWIEMWSKTITYKNRNADMVMMIDITGRKKAEDKLKLLSNIVKQSTEGIALADMKGNIDFVNEAWCKMHGYKDQKYLIGKNLKIFHSKEQMENDVIPFNKKVKKNGTFSGEVGHIRKDGKSFPTLMTSTLVKNEKGVLTGIAGLAMDITERKKVEEELIRYKDNLEELVDEKNKEIKSFTSSIAHDMNAPLRAINGYVNILLEDFTSQLSKEGENIGNAIKENSNKIGALIKGLRMFVNIGQKDITLLHTDMKEAVKAAYNDITNSDEQKRIDLKIKDIPDAVVDKEMIHHVWRHLLMNAIKFSRDKDISIITVSCKDEDSKLIYSITDNGIGFDMKYHDELFSLFRRLHVDSDIEGHGVGLALFERIIKRQKGKVWAESNEGEGATFYFSLPKL